MSRAPAGVDRATKEWIRNASDERAARAGFRFDAARGQYTVDWIERYCRLYEGDAAGEPLILRDWQLECVMRIFGWVRWSDKWGREIRRFRKASCWMPKKNKKSPTLAAIGLYLFAGDGEQGQKCFSSAKDGRQAMISHTHAIEMVRKSDELLDECTINASTIVHVPTRSQYRIVAGDNANSQEGLNGSVLVDETHVVDWALMKILEGAGISRSEPLHIEASTAGNNPDGYGKAQFVYAGKVASGEIVDHTFFSLIYAAPQDLVDSELAKDPVKWGKIANPAWGHTIDPDEFASAFQSSRQQVGGLATFKMYRLNIWQQSINPWLKMGDWEKCRRDYTLADLAGRACWAGLDLSLKHDMSALSMVFKVEGELLARFGYGDDRQDAGPTSKSPALPGDAYCIWPVFWMPRATAERNNHLHPFLAWAEQGHLILTPGEVVDFGYIESDIREKFALVSPRELVFDPYKGEQLTQRISEGETAKDGKQMIEGLGVPRIEFAQTAPNFATPSDYFERLIIAGRMHHAGNPVMTWQIGHVNCKADLNANVRPVKPKPGDIRKIDGVVATVMGLAQAMKGEGGPSVYETRGPVFI